MEEPTKGMREVKEPLYLPGQCLKTRSFFSSFISVVVVMLASCGCCPYELLLLLCTMGVFCFFFFPFSSTVLLSIFVFYKESKSLFLCCYGYVSCEPPRVLYFPLFSCLFFHFNFLLWNHVTHPIPRRMTQCSHFNTYIHFISPVNEH